MVNHIISLLALFITFFNIVDSSKIASSFPHPVPPQPSQYTTSITFNGQPAIYHADTTVYRDRLDVLNQNYATITDFQSYRYYTILKDMCSWAQIPGKISPMLVFPNYDFNGNLTHNTTFCYKWSGCHYYEIPPAPFNYYASIKDNMPVNLNLPTININIQFSNFTYGPPPSSIFDIPHNCTQIEYNSKLHPIFSHIIIENTGVESLC